MDISREDPTIATTDGSCAARDHLAALREHGGSYRAIGTAAGLGPMTVHGIATGRRQPTTGTAAAVLAVSPASLRRSRVDAGGTRLRLRALHVMGHSSARIARAAGVSDKTIRKLLRGDAKTISLRLRDAIADVYDAWWDKCPPERTRAERAAARAARRRAIAGNWCAGAALDDDQLDTPGYRPAHGWKPATGTGPAADVHPRTKTSTDRAQLPPSPRATGRDRMTSKRDSDMTGDEVRELASPPRATTYRQAETGYRCTIDARERFEELTGTLGRGRT